MKNFFKTLIEPNLPNILKWLGGLTVSILGLIASGQLVIPWLPTWIAILIPVILGGGTVAGVHAYHTMDKPEVPLAKR